MPVDATYYRELLRPLCAGRRWVLFGQPLAAYTLTVRLLRDLGAERCLIIASNLGTGPLPSPDDADWVVLNLHAPDMIAEFRQVARLFTEVPADARTAVERYDPEVRAWVLAPITLHAPPPTLLGRRLIGRRQPAGVALEDKVVIDAFWDRVQLKRAPSKVLPVRALPEAAHALDRGQGTVWAGDAREGAHGGAMLLRWVRSGADTADAKAFFAAQCDRVRVMPFLEGIPCSIHGIVFPETVAAFRPVEMVTLRPPHGSQLRYSGAATFWDPPEADRAYMRECARRVGEALRREVAFRGAFTIDGVMTEDGFLPTELNPRFGAGLGVLGRSLPELPLGLLAFVAMEDEPLDYRPRDLETLVVDAADAHRTGGAWTVIPGKRERSEEHALVEGDGQYRLARAGEAPDATLTIGPSAVGGFVRFTPDALRVPVGISIAGRAANAFALADREFGTGIGPLQAARSVR
jgi:hypothetical protein